MEDTSSGTKAQSDGILTLLNGGELDLNNGSSLTANQVNIDQGALGLDNDQEFIVPINLVSDGHIYLDEEYTPTISSKISGAGPLKIHGKVLTLTGANDYTGGTILFKGSKLQLGDNLAAGKGMIEMADETTLTFSSELALDNNFELTGDNTIDTDNYSVDINGVINGGGILIKEGDAILTLNKANNYHSGTKLNAGSIILGDNLAAGVGAISMADGTLLGAAKSLEIDNSITLNAQNIFDSSEYTFTLNGVIDGDGALKKYGTGTVLLKKANSYKGGTKISEGTLSLGDNTAAGDGTISLDNKVTLAAEKDIQIANDIILTADNYASLDTQGNSFTIKKIVSDDEVSLYKTGSGKLIIDAMNYNYAGYTTIKEGTIQLLHYNSLGDSSIIIEGGGILQAGVDSLGIGNSIDLTGVATIDTQQYSFIINNQVSGDSGSLTKIGSGILFLDAANGYGGNTNLNEGTINLHDDKSAGNGKIVMAAGTTIQAAKALNLSNKISLAGDATIDTQNYDVTLKKEIDGDGGLTKVGTGILALMLANSYKGDTKLNAGTISLNDDAAASTGKIDMATDTVLQASKDLGLDNLISLTGSPTIDTKEYTLTAKKAIDGDGSLTKIGTGILALNAENKYTGGTKLTDGILSLGHNKAAGTDVINIDDKTTLVASQNIEIDNKLSLTGTDLITIDTHDNSLQINGEISGGANLKKIGSGTLILNAVNKHTKGTTLEAGIILLLDNKALGENDLTIKGLATLQAGKEISIDNNINLNGGGTFDTKDYSLTINKQITGDGGLTKIGTGTIALKFANDYTGDTNLNAGILSLEDDNAASTGNILMKSGTTLQAAKKLDLDNKISLVGSATINTGSYEVNIQQPIDGNGSLIKDGSGLLALNVANSYKGNTNLNAGTLSLGDDKSASSGKIIMAEGTKLQAAKTLNLGNKFNLDGDATIDTQDYNVLIKNSIDGDGSLIKEGSGILALSETGSYSGGTKLKAGTIELTRSNAVGDGKIEMSEGTTLKATDYLLLANKFLLDGAVTIDSGQYSIVIKDIIDGTGPLTKKGGGALLLKAANKYSEGTKIEKGTLSLFDNQAAGAGDITIGNGAILSADKELAIDNKLQLVGSANIYNGVDFTINKAISGEGSLHKTGSGTLFLKAVNDYTEGTTINEGTINLGNDDALGKGDISIEYGATLQAGNKLDLTNKINLAGDASIDTKDYDVTLKNTIDGDGILTKLGSGMLTLKVANNYGGTQLNEGILNLENDQAAGNEEISMAAGTKLQAAKKLELSNKISLDGDATIDTKDYGISLTNKVDGDGSLTKEGSGILALMVANGYSSGTKLNEGTIQLNDDSAAGSGKIEMADATTLQAGKAINLDNLVSLTGSPVIDTQGYTLTAKKTIDGDGSLTKKGSGILALKGVNSYTGGIKLSEGILGLGNNKAAGTGKIEMDSGTTLRAIDSLLLDNKFSLNGNVVFDSAGYSISINEVIDGNGALTKKGNTSLRLKKANSYKGGTIIEQGTLSLADNQAAGSGDLITINHLAILEAANNLDMPYKLKLTSGIASIHTQNYKVNINEEITGNGGLSIWGDGTVALNKASNYGGDTYLQYNAKLILGNDQATSSGTINVYEGSILQAAKDISLANLISLIDTLTIDTQGNKLTAQNTIDGKGGLIKTGAGTLLLNIANSFKGGTKLNEGTISLNDDKAAGSGKINISGATLQAAKDINLTNLISLTNTSIIDTQSNKLTATNTIDGTGSLTKKGLGILVLNIANSYSGGTKLNEGTISLNDDRAMGAGKIEMADKTILQAGKAINLDNLVSLTGSPVIDTQGYTLTAKKTIDGDGSLTKKGSGILALNVANGYSSGTKLDEGTIRLNDDSAAGSGKIEMAAGTTLQAGKKLALSNKINLAGDGTFDTQDFDVVANTEIEGEGALIKSGSGILALKKANSYNGGTKLNEGKLQLLNNQALGSGKLDMLDNTHLILLGNLIIPNVINLNNSHISVPKFYGAIIENISLPANSTLSKEDEGVLSLPASNQLDGNMQIKKGTVFLSDTSISGNVVIENNAKLRGKGHILTDLINKGVLERGNSAGILNVDGKYIQDPQGKLRITIAPSKNPIAGEDYDQLSVQGTADITGSNVIISAIPGDYVSGTEYPFLKAASGRIGEFSNFLLNIMSPYQGQLIYNPNDVTLLISGMSLPDVPSKTLQSNSDIAKYINSLEDKSESFIKDIESLYSMASDELEDNLKSIAPNRNLVANYISNDLTHFIHDINHVRLDRESDQKDANNISNNFNFTTNKSDLPNINTNLLSKIGTNLNQNLLNSDTHYMWLTPFAQLINHKNSNYSYGHEAKTMGMAFGYDYKLNDRFIGGLSLGYYNTNFDHHHKQGKDNKINSIFASLYGSKKLGNAYLKASLVGSFNKNHLNRNIHIAENQYNAESRHNSHIISPRLTLGYKIDSDCYDFIPFISTEYTTSFNKDYNESGAGPLNMHVHSGKNDLLVSEFGIKLRKAIALGNEEVLRLKTQLSYIRKKRFRHNNRIKAQFIDQETNYKSYNYNKAENRLATEVGIELKQENGLVIEASYNGEFGKSYYNHGIMFQLGREF